MAESNGTAAAVAEAEAQTIEQETPALDPQAEGGLDPNAVAAGEGTPEVSPEAAAPDEEPTVDVGKSLAELRGTEPPAEGVTEPPLKAGTSLDELEAQSQAQYEQTRNTVFQYGDQEVQRILRDDLGLDGADSQKAWEKMRSLLHMLDVANDKRRYSVINEQVKEALKDDPAAAEAYFSKAYGAIPEAVAGGVVAGRSVANAEWKAKVDKGEYLTPKEAEKLIENDRIAQKEYWRKRGINFGENSGPSPNGATAGKSEDELLLDPDTDIKVVNEILARRNGGQ